MNDDERVVWLRAKPGRKVIQIIEPAPCGFSVTTQWIEGGQLVRQDAHVAVRPVNGNGEAKGV